MGHGENKTWSENGTSTETWTTETTYESWHKKIPPLWKDIIGYATKLGESSKGKVNRSTRDRLLLEKFLYFLVPRPEVC